MTVRSATNIDTILGQRLKKLRKQNKFTQAGLAKEVGVTFQMVQKYENGRSRFTVSRLLEFADALNLTIADFLMGLRRDLDDNIFVDPMADTIIKYGNIIAALETYPPDVQKHVEGFLTYTAQCGEQDVA